MTNRAWLLLRMTKEEGWVPSQLSEVEDREQVLALKSIAS
jgi:hypothetical protein